MTGPRIFVFVNGILTRSGAHDGWTDRAVTWTNSRTAHKAEKWEYTTGALLRRLRQQDRAEKIATMLAYYQRAGFHVSLVGHSNGCDIIARVLALRGQEPWYFLDTVRSAHLFSPAADGSDFARALDEADLGRLHIYGSANDKALQFGAWSRRLFGWAGLGYGSLGLESCPLLGRKNVFTCRRDEFGHSTWFDKGEQFEATMQQIHTAENLSQ